jgi:hypothetical protein
MTVDIWIRDYNPPRCFQKKISGRSKHNDAILVLVCQYDSEDVQILMNAVGGRNNDYSMVTGLY